MPPGTATGRAWTIRSCGWTGRTSCCAPTCPRRSFSNGPHAVKQNAGDLILYPSGSLHHVTPVTCGTRLCARLWIQSMVRDIQRRTLLFDLDRSVQALTRERGTTDAEVHRLTGVHHTLVRLWADV